MRRAIGLAAVGMTILAGGCAGQQGDPPSSDRPAGNDAAQEQGVNNNPEQVLASAEQRLGDAYAGGYLDDGGRPVVLTTDESTVEAVRALGARPEVAAHNMAALQDWQMQVNAALGAQPPPAVTSWGIDVPRNAVAVDVLAGQPVPPQLQQVVDRSGGAVVLAEAPGPVTPLPVPGPAPGS
ncbi:MAG: alpha-lytic protease prodomain-containing protein [Pseudonocardiaceae bacterium]